MSLVLLFSVAITLIDAFVHPNYFVKIPIKILFFLASEFPKPIELKHIKCETSKVRKYKLRKKELEEYLKDIYNKPVNFVK